MKNRETDPVKPSERIRITGSLPFPIWTGILPGVLMMFLLSGATFFCGKPGEQAGTPLKAIAVFVKGDVFLTRGETREPLHTGNLIFQEDRIEAGPTGVADIKLSDNSLVRIKAASAVSLDQLVAVKGREKIRLSVRRGVTKNLILKYPRNAGYHVETPTAIASVRGTRFDVRASEVMSRFQVIQGRVAVQSRQKEQQERILEKGQGVTIYGDGREEPSRDRKWLKKSDREFDAMERHLRGEKDDFVREATKLKKVKSEKELRKIYNTLELVILKDGRQLRGAVVKQDGKRLIFHSVGNVEIINMSDVVKVKMIKEEQSR